MNPTATIATAPVTASSAMPGNRLLRAYLTEAKYELIRILRLPGFLLPFFVLPAALYLFFGVVMGATKDPKIAIYLFAGMSTFGIIGPAMFGFGIYVATDREQGLLTLKRALPMPPAAYLLAKTIMALLFAAAIMLTMTIAGHYLGNLKLSASQLLGVAAVETLGAAPFCAIGLYIGSWASAKSAPAFVNLLYLPMIYLSGLFFELPKAARGIMLASPAFYLNQLTVRMAGLASYGLPIVHVAVLVAVTIFFMTVAIRRMARVG